MFYFIYELVGQNNEGHYAYCLFTCFIFIINVYIFFTLIGYYKIIILVL